MNPLRSGTSIPRRPSGRTGVAAERYVSLFEQLTPLMGVARLDQIGPRACELIAAVLRVEACSLLVAEPPRGTFRLAGASHIPPDQWAAVAVPLHEGICAQVWREGRARLVRGRRQFRAQFGREPQARYGVPSCVIAPVAGVQRVHGVINVAQPVGRRALRDRDRIVLEAAARLIGSALDAAERACQTELLQRQLEAMFDSLLVGVLSIDDHGRLQYLNRRARLFCGLDEPQVRAHPHLADVLPRPLYPVCRRLLQQLGPQHDALHERVELTLEGAPAHLGLTVTRLSACEDGFGDRLIIIENLSREAELERLRESEAMKRTFLSIISHELRTPLAVLRGALPLIDPDAGIPITPETLRRTHRLMLKNCHRLSEVVDAMLDVTEIENSTLKLNPQPVDVNELIASVIESLDELARERRLSWRVTLEDGLPIIHADPRRLRQVIRELAGNAIKFTAPGEWIGIESRRSAEGVRIEVSNPGEPLPPEVRRSLFDKFFQGNSTSTRTAGGCGLGLFLAQSLVNLHGGRIELLDGTDRMVVFRIELPLGEAAHEVR